MICSIDPSRPDTWEGNISITFDIEWAHDEILLDTVNILEQAGASATWFVTHDTPILGRLRDHPWFELGIHPNFNYLLNGEKKNGSNAEEVIDVLMELVPEAKSIRSHAMTQNSNLLDLFKKKGLTHDCNHFIPEQTEIFLRPWKLWNGLIRIPYFWEDDVTCMYEKNTSIEGLVQRKGLKVFDFHPIHVFLNTEHLDRYEQTRRLHHNPKELIKHRYEGEGTRTKLLRLLQQVKTRSESSG